MAAIIDLKVGTCPSQELALTNKVFMNPDDYRKLFGSKVAKDDNTYLTVKQFVLTACSHPKVEQGSLGMTVMHRRSAELSLNETITVKAFKLEPSQAIYLSMVEFEIGFLSRGASPQEYDCDKLAEMVQGLLNLQFLTKGQMLVIEVHGINLQLTVQELHVVDLKWFKRKNKDESGDTSSRGLMTNKTDVCFIKAPASQIKLKGAHSSASMQRPTLFRQDWNFESMGIGGLDSEFSNIFRRAFASRVFPPAVIQQLGISHVKGILLYGPPGTGKTLMARQIGKMLNGREPKVVNGPEILNKYVGQSEENIRNLFRDAEMEYKARGDDSDLHIIIFDEIDAICKQRGTTGGGTGVQDTVVNQLLSKIDGVESLNNVLIIGMTNRKDMIDEALLRPGRLEVHMEISLPDEQGRTQIFKIHTAKMQRNKCLAEDVDIGELANLTKNYTGAEIEGVVKSAASFALNRLIDVSNLNKQINTEEVILCRNDFLAALNEVRPKFGVTSSDLEQHVPNGIINYGPSFQKLLQTGRLFLEQVQHSTRTPLVTVLLEGRRGSGKTAIGCTLALESSFPFVKLITPEDLVGYTDAGKCSKIKEAFEDAYKSPLSVIVLDDIERLLEYVPIGLRFSNNVLQTLMVLLGKAPPKGRRLLVLGTSSSKQVLQDMGLLESFNATLSVPCVSGGDEARRVLDSLQSFDAPSLDLAVKSIVQPVPIKILLMVAEMAKQGDHLTLGERFIQCMEDYGLNSKRSQWD